MPRPHSPGRLERWLEAAPAWTLVLYATFASFSTYFCMYAFRKPFTAAQYAGDTLLGTQMKTAFVISQILGYAASKFLGIRVCSEATRSRRAAMIVGLIVWAELALVLFAVVPPPLKTVALFLNGLPLGMVWGLVVWYLEGRRTSELLLAGLSASFILASDVVRDVGRFLMRRFEVSEWWMPAATGLVFLPPLLAAVWLLNRVPAPSEADRLARVERRPMDSTDRRSFLAAFLPGLILLVIAYFFLTAYRDFRDNYAIEILETLGFAGDAAVFTKMGTPVAFGVLVPLALLVVVRNHRAGLAGAYAIMTSGAVILGGATMAFDRGQIDGFWWMVLTGLGVYLAYVPYGSVLFDRLMASTRFVGTAVFAIYIADAIGYCGSIAVQLYKDFGQKDVSRFEFFRRFSYVTCAVSLACMAASWLYLRRQIRRRSTGPWQAPSFATAPVQQDSSA